MYLLIVTDKVLYKFLLGPGLGERCDGGSQSESSVSQESTNEDSTRRSRRKNQVRGRVRGARERKAYGKLEPAQLQCQDDLVCVEVGVDRRECQLENQNGI